MMAWSVHHVRALTPSFVSGGDDYLFLLADGSCKVRATSSPATTLASAAAAIVALVTLLAAVSACACSVLRYMPSAHCPHRLWTAAVRARSS